MISQASSSDPTKLLYRTLNLPKHGAEVVESIEKIQSIKKTLPDELKSIGNDIYVRLEKSLISTTSIKGWHMDKLTTTKTKIEVNNPQVRKNVLQKMGGMSE